MSSATPALPTSLLDARHFAMTEHVAALSSHLHQCAQTRDWSFRLAVLGERIHALIAPRLILTVSCAALVLGAISSWA